MKKRLTLVEIVLGWVVLLIDKIDRKIRPREIDNKEIINGEVVTVIDVNYKVVA